MVLDIHLSFIQNEVASVTLDRYWECQMNIQSRHMAFFLCHNPSLVKAKIAAVKAKDCSHGRRQIPEYLRTTRMTLERTVLVTVQKLVFYC